MLVYLALCILSILSLKYFFTCLISLSRHILNAMKQDVGKGSLTVAEAGQRGGEARAEVLSPERRKEIARKAIETRWAKQRKTKAAAKTPAKKGK